MTLGLVFFLAGTVGLLRFPDVYTRLHTVTKADNVGLGLIIFGLAVDAQSVWEVVELFLVWGLVMVASTTAAHLISRRALAQGITPWKESS
ncbi:monovalent cation/H(+) antiporter subunit G [Persicimonas caeni]|uniref:Monovalent cation/H(+) antiporter subunit G n=2 Tax=Persicimonas caeni TaxID=2292766 RepID=A0A4Y6Q447_PERCE|nr:monovalent cation/H(+) antiporter subunit G [Persicimonas caeni]QED36148.1 monovalent cation/H(+) antiporter subunit G [Persicimonas caeni]